MNSEDVSSFLNNSFVSPIKFDNIKKPKLRMTNHADPKSHV